MSDRRAQDTPFAHDPALALAAGATAGVPGICGALVMDPEGGVLLALRADELFPAASVIKVPLVAALHAEAAAGRIALDEPVAVGDRVQGTGVLHDLRDVQRVTLRDLAALALTVSDNTAANLLIDRVGTDTVNAWLDAWGCGRTRLRRRMYDFAAAERGLENVMTPRDAALLLRRLWAGDCGGRTASDEVVAALLRCQDASMLGRFLPDGLPLAHKTGLLSRSRNDVGIFPAERGGSVIVAAFVRDTSDLGRASDWIGLLGVGGARLAGRPVALPRGFGA
ncbi:MAG: serine hydrolase [Chloroflexi bacterium]|nr:serine hydrolase [Chloroflexota bacterium]